MKVSCWLSPGIYVYFFDDDKIVVSEWDKIPPITTHWVQVNGGGEFRFEGTCIDDIRVVRRRDI